MPAALFADATDSTLQNLLSAHETEVNTRARYLAFADQADAEGHAGVASLFRAAARAEQIHANSQARVLRQMGAETHVRLSPVLVRETMENLKSALAGETAEIDSVYPSFIDEATARINSTAARSFWWALEAEKTHAALFAEAIGLLDDAVLNAWTSERRIFYVCPVCAGTSQRLAEDNCTICNYPAERAEEIN